MQVQGQSFLDEMRWSSRGYVRMTNADPLTNPKIFCNYLSTDADRQTAVSGLRMTRRIMAAPALARYTARNW